MTFFKKQRERLCLIHYISTDRSEYFVYNTQTIQGYDCVNIEIVRYCKSAHKFKLILEDKIFEDSWGAMGGSSFDSLVHDALRHLIDYTIRHHEIIYQNVKIDSTPAQEPAMKVNFVTGGNGK